MFTCDVSKVKMRNALKPSVHRAASAPSRLLKSLSFFYSRSQWPSGLRRGSVAGRLLRLWVRIPPEAWRSVCCECCVLSGRGLCDELITRPEEAYRVWCVWVWSWSLENEDALAHWGLSCQEKKYLTSNKTVIFVWCITETVGVMNDQLNQILFSLIASPSCCPDLGHAGTGHTLPPATLHTCNGCGN